MLSSSKALVVLGGLDFSTALSLDLPVELLTGLSDIAEAEFRFYPITA